jgi:serpin B
MKRSSRTWIALLFALAACNGTRTGNPTLPEDPGLPAGVSLAKSKLARTTGMFSDPDPKFARDNQDFAFDLYGEVAGDGTENLFFSPYSISVALAMTYAGARDETEQQIAEALNFTLPQGELHGEFNVADYMLESRSEPVEYDGETFDGLELSTINASFAERTLNVEAPFLDTLAQNYGAGVYLADFIGKPDESRVAINDWVMDQTRDRIVDLLPAQSILSDTVMVLVNAIFFKANWREAFDAKNTADGVFHTPAGDVTVPLMHAKQRRMYAEGDGYRAVELPYIPTTVKMLFVLPDEGRFSEIEGRLGSDFLADLIAAREQRDANITLPRFGFNYELQLKPALEALGMPIAFINGEADFTGISTDLPISIAEVYHQAFIALDEKGTEAAAATAVVLIGESSGPEPATITLDRPFLFLIYDEPTGQILFLGRVVDPS